MPERLANFSWDDIRLVKAIADAGSLAGAAEQLGLNHSTVFRRLAGLEETMGTPLFERHRGGYQATAAGEEMAGLGQRMEEDVAAFTRKLAGNEPAPRGELRVTTNDTMLVHLLTPILGRFLKAYPEIRLDIVLGNQALNLSKRDADIAIRATDNPPDTLVGRKLAQIDWALYGRKIDFPARLKPEQYLTRNWVSLGESFGQMKVVKFARENVAPEKIIYKLSTVLGLTEAVEAGIGIGHLPCFIANGRDGLRQLAPPEPEFGTGLWLLTHPDLRHAPRVRAFMDFVAAEITRERVRIEAKA